LGGITEDDGAVVGGVGVDLGQLAATDVYDLALALRLAPLTLEFVKQRVSGMEVLKVQILKIGHGSGDAPGHGPVVAEERQTGDAGERQPHRIERRTGQVILIIDVGDFQRSVGIAGQQRCPTRCSAAGDDPVVAAPLQVGEQGRRVRSGPKLFEARPRLPTVFAIRRDDQRLARWIAAIEPGGQLRSQVAQQTCAPQLGLPDAAGEHMPHLEDGEGVPWAPGLRGGVKQLILDRPQRHGVENGIDAVGIGLEHRARLRMHGGVIGASADLQSQAT